MYKGNMREKFNWKKFKKVFSFFDPVEWIKSLKEMGLLDLRKLAVYGLAATCIYAYGQYKGAQGKPVEFNLDYEKEFHLKLDGHYLHKPSNSTNMEVVDEKGKVLKTVTVQDIPELQKKLKPIGFEFTPIGVIGAGTGNSGTKLEAGAGIRFLKYWQWRAEGFLTNKGVYVGTSYKLSKWKKLQNSSVGIAAGKGYKGDNRALFYYCWEF
jgi:hypothetical protein